MLDFYYQFAQVLERENPVLATVIASKGSVPREIGAKMLILNNGEILQTIGEGAGEAKVIRAAMIVSATGRKRAIALGWQGGHGFLRKLNWTSRNSSISRV
jgi:xanthine dehydrogenase accessory factor